MTEQSATLKHNTPPLARTTPTLNRSPFAKVKRVFFGAPLGNKQKEHEKLGVFGGLVVLAVDALSSVAYATEEILLALMVAGTSALFFSPWIGLAIALLIAIVVASYTQTVQAFPKGGGAYIVAKSELGKGWALLAAAALLIDYVLTVAVSVTAGVQALLSAHPMLGGHQVLLCSMIIATLTWVNLRGIRESALLLAVPVLLFIGAMGMLSVTGLGWSLGHEVPTITAAPVLVDFAMVLVLLRAFAGGCTALTGIEAIANAGGILEAPSHVVARRILILLGTLLIFFFLSITLVASFMGVVPSGSETVISFIARTLYGEGILYHVTMAMTALVLFFAANTAFAGFPTLASMLAIDGWMPKQFAAVGDRLVFSNGIIGLAIAATTLVVFFNGSTHHLIPLYAIGVFTAFSLSQWGMVHYWLRHKSTQGLALGKIVLNGTGAIVTTVALCITFEAKFHEGAYLVMIAVPGLMWTFYSIHRHYTKANLQLRLLYGVIKNQRIFSTLPNRTMVVPISTLHKGAVEALAFAREMSTDVVAILVDVDHLSVLDAKEKIESLGWDIHVEILPSPFRSIIDPIVRYVHHIDHHHQDLAVLILPELVLVRWWQGFLHNNTAKAIASALTWSEPLPGHARIIINVPYYLKV